MHPTLHALIERNLVICVGPLVSEAAGLAGPRGLAQHFVESLHPMLPDRAELAALVAAGEVARALERVERLIGSARFIDVARPLLDRGDARLPLVARAIAALSPELGRICTTNLDTLLERALESWPALDAEPRDLGGRERCLVKLCGTAAQVSSWVLTRERLLARGAELPRTGSWLRRYRLLIVGYRADDEVLRRLVLPLRGRDACGLEPVNLAYVPADSVTPESRELLAEYGIELVPIAGDYDLGAAEWLHALFDAYQRETRTRSRPPYHRRYYDGYWCPYRGLAPFESGDEAQLFGRAADVHRAIEQLRVRPESRWLIVHGADGIGTSSFVAAGVYPATMRGAAWTTPGEPTWHGLRGRVHRRPLLALAESMASLAASRLRSREYDEPEPGEYDEPEPGEYDAPEDEATGLDPAPTTAALHEQFGASTRALADHLASSHPGGLVLAVDGLEDAIDSDDDEEQERFAASVAHALAHAAVPFLLITPIRSRYLGELHRLPQLLERMTGRDPPVIYALAPMTEDALRQVIRGPGERAGIIVAERLVERILADVDRLTRAPQPPQPGTVLALLAAALAGTYHHMKHGEFCETAYEAGAGLAGAVERYAEQAVAAAIADYSETWVRRVFLLVLAGEVDRRGRPRPLTHEEVIERLLPHVPADRPRNQRVRAENVLRRTSVAAGGLISVSKHCVTLLHDVLRSHWPRLRAWQAPDWQPPVGETPPSGTVHAEMVAWAWPAGPAGHDAATVRSARKHPRQRPRAAPPRTHPRASPTRNRSSSTPWPLNDPSRCRAAPRRGPREPSQCRAPPNRQPQRTWRRRRPAPASGYRRSG
ncbi:SIR2 family protein [Nannocystis pusilla]|uniref:SIR2 family protein n=1 Tax=Nannocystis pusilla TaxID=889268 RepID=A0A9X3F8I4_9BACT|nr:SIR2 family protein [Nannocystis pusilla]MCY1013401.1 SIR2 family protein [Nannocystis pusilla]